MGGSRSWGGGDGAVPEGTVLRRTALESTVPAPPPAAGGAGLRPARAGGGQGREVVASDSWRLPKLSRT